MGVVVSQCWSGIVSWRKMAFYIMHDSFIRPTTTVLNTRNYLNRERNILTKKEKRKCKIYEKENVPIISCENSPKSLTKVTMIAKENSLDEYYDTAEVFDISKPELKETEKFLTRQQSTEQKYFETVNQVLNFPLTDSEEIEEQRCKKFKDNKHIQELKALVKRESESSLIHVDKGKDLILNHSKNETEEIIEEACSHIETDLLKSSEYKETIEHPRLNIAEMNENFVLHKEESLRNIVPFNQGKMEGLKVKEETNLKAVFLEKEILFNHDCSIPKRPERAKKERNNNMPCDINNRIQIQKSIDGFIHNNLRDVVNHVVNDAHVFNTPENDCDEDELPNLEFVDKNILMQEELLKRNQVDRKNLHNRKINADKLTTVSNLESDNFKRRRHEILNYDTSKKSSKARSRLISPGNKKDRTIEKEYSVYRNLLHTEKLKKTNKNNKINHSGPVKGLDINETDGIKYKEANININFSCNSTANDQASNVPLNVLVTALSLIASSLFVISIMQILVELGIK